MTENKGTRADLPPEGGVDEVTYAKADEVKSFDPDDDLSYGGEGGEGQQHRVGNGYQS